MLIAILTPSCCAFVNRCTLNRGDVDLHLVLAPYLFLSQAVTIHLCLQRIRFARQLTVQSDEQSYEHMDSLALLLDVSLSFLLVVKSGMNGSDDKVNGL